MLTRMRQLWRDETGAILSAELIIISSVLILGLVVGLTTLQRALASEATDVANAFRNLDQSYYYTGFTGCRKYCGHLSYTAGSRFMNYRGACEQGDDCEVYRGTPLPPSPTLAPCPTGMNCAPNVPADKISAPIPDTTVPAVPPAPTTSLVPAAPAVAESPATVIEPVPALSGPPLGEPVLAGPCNDCPSGVVQGDVTYGGYGLGVRAPGFAGSGVTVPGAVAPEGVLPGGTVPGAIPYSATIPGGVAYPGFDARGMAAQFGTGGNVPVGAHPLPPSPYYPVKPPRFRRPPVPAGPVPQASPTI